jgi:hypothetical protein
MVPLFALFAREASTKREATNPNNAKGGTGVVDAERASHCGVTEAAKRFSWGCPKPQSTLHWEQQGAIFCIVRIRRFAIWQRVSGEQC